MTTIATMARGMTRAPASMRELVDQPLKELSKLYENSLKAMLVCGLEFYLTASLVASFFQCPDEAVQAVQELQALYTVAWMPMLLATVLVYGPKISSSYFPSPNNFERNMLRCKFLTWVCTFAYLIWDPDMTIKTGPSLGVSIIFCVTDVGRFIMDMKHLTDVEYDDNGNSFVAHDDTLLEDQQQEQQRQQERQQQRQQQRKQQRKQERLDGQQLDCKPLPQQQVQEESYTVHMIGAGQEASQSTSQYRQQSSANLAVNQASNSGNRLQSEQLHDDKDDQDLEPDQSPIMNTKYVAILESSSRKEHAELITKKSFTYEF